MKTKSETEALKQDWMRDPCWDIEDTDGFEDHYEELRTFREEKEKIWEKERIEKRERSVTVDGILDVLEVIENRSGFSSMDGNAVFMAIASLTRAIVNQTEEFKRVNDNLDRIGNLLGGVRHER